MWSDPRRLVAWSDVATTVAAFVLGVALVALMAWGMRPTPEQDAAQVRAVQR